MNNSRRLSLWREGLLASCLYGLVTFVLTFPFSTTPASTVLGVSADTNLLVWLVAWDVHAFLTNPLAIFDANIYHPLRYTLAYSENIIGTSLLVAPLLLATGNAVLALNVATLLSCVLCGTGAYILVRRLGFGPAAALLSGLIFAFAPPRFFRLTQVHIGAMQWIPFAFAFLHEYFDTGNRRKLWWACGFFTLQVLTSGHGAVFAAVSIGLFLLWRIALGEPIAPLQRLRDLHVPGVLLLVVAILPMLPYRAVQGEVGLRRTIRDAYTWAPNPATLLASPTYVHQWLMSLWTDWPVLAEAKAYLFPGYLALALGLVGVWTLRQTYQRAPAERATVWTRLAVVLEAGILVTLLIALLASVMGGFRVRFYGEVIFSARNVGRAWLAAVVFAVARLALVRRAPLEPGPRFLRVRARYRRWAEARRTDAVAFYALLAVVTFWLALGPEYWLYWFVYDLPGFNFIRVPTRYTLLTLLALAVLAAAGFEYLTARLRPAARWTLAALCAAVLVGEYVPVPFVGVPYRLDLPPIDRWLDTLPKPFAVAELPLDYGPNLAGQELRQSRYMLHATAHWQKTVHGYGGIRSKLHAAIFSDMAQFPDDLSLIALTSVAVNYVVIHTDYYTAGEWARVEAKLANFTNWLTLEKVIDSGRVYSLRRPPPEELLRGRFKEFVNALDAGDAQALSSFYTADARMVRPNGRIFNGGAAIAAWILENPREAALLTLEPRSFNPDTGTVRGRFTLGSGRSAPRGEFMQVWKPVYERWMLAEDFFSVEGVER